jgi:hypothetical protein
MSVCVQGRARLRGIVRAFDSGLCTRLHPEQPIVHQPVRVGHDQQGRYPIAMIWDATHPINVF